MNVKQDNLHSKLEKFVILYSNLLKKLINFFIILVIYTDMWIILHKTANNDENISILLLAR
jgi:hypothetical protein